MPKGMLTEDTEGVAVSILARSASRQSERLAALPLPFCTVVRR